MSVSKRLHYESTVRDTWVTTRLCQELGMGPDEIAAVTGGYFADLHAGAVVAEEDDDSPPGEGATCEDKLTWLDHHRPARRKPAHPGPCAWQETRVAGRNLGAKPDLRGEWYLVDCRLCGRFYGYRRVK